MKNNPWSIEKFTLKRTHFACTFDVTISRNFNVATSNAAEDDRPPPSGTFVMTTASNPGTGKP